MRMAGGDMAQANPHMQGHGRTSSQTVAHREGHPARTARTPGAGAQPVALYLHRDAELYRRHRRWLCGDRSRTGREGALARARCRDRRRTSLCDHVHAYAPRPFTRRQDAGGAHRRADRRLRPTGARRQRAARRCLVRPHLRTRQGHGRWRTDDRPRLDAYRGCHTRPCVQPPVLRARGKRRAVHRRPYHGVVDQRRDPARW